MFESMSIRRGRQAGPITGPALSWCSELYCVLFKTQCTVRRRKRDLGQLGEFRVPKAFASPKRGMVTLYWAMVGSWAAVSK